MRCTILVTGASYGFGLLAARELALAGHIVYAGDPQISPQSIAQVKKIEKWAEQRGVDLRMIDLNVQSTESVNTAITQIMDVEERLDVVVHGASHMAFGPAESFTPEQMHWLYDVNVVGAQRVNRAVLPYLRKQGTGYLIWLGSLTTHMGASPFLAPYYAAKAAMDTLAVSYSTELARWGIETTIIMLGAFTKKMNRLANAEMPGDAGVADEYVDGPYANVADQVLVGLAGLESEDTDPRSVGHEIARVVNIPFGKRPFRVHVGQWQDGAAESLESAEKMHRELHHALGLQDLVPPEVHD
jgi:NAD(P)-dependent dehydrogenase (short-subunit alcohol dehydrogenase family)